MRLPDSVRAAAREAGRNVVAKYGSPDDVVEAVLLVIEDHPDMNALVVTHREDHGKEMRQNIFEERNKLG